MRTDDERSAAEGLLVSNATMCFKADTWQAMVYQDVFNMVRDEYDDNTVNGLAGSWWTDWNFLFPCWSRPSYLALRSVVRYALRATGAEVW